MAYGFCKHRSELIIKCMQPLAQGVDTNMTVALTNHDRGYLGMVVQLYVQAFADFACHSYQHNILEMFVYLVYIYTLQKNSHNNNGDEITSYRVTNYF